MKRFAGLGATVLFAVTLFLLSGCTPRWLVRKVADSHAGCLYDVQTSEKLVALTIDDGPDRRTTPAILKVLAQHNASATFFLISSRVSGNDTLVARLLREGHEIGNHFSHAEASSRLTHAEFTRSLHEADSVLKGFANVRWVRPGSGWYNARMLRVFDANGYDCALGSVYAFDPQLPFPGHTSRVVLRGAYPGAIVILHDFGYKGRNTVKVLKLILPELQRRGYRIVTLSRLAESDTSTAATK